MEGEGLHQVQTGAPFAPHQSRLLIRDMDYNELLEYIRNQEEDKAIQFLRNFRLSDLMFFKNTMSDMTLIIDKLHENKKDFYDSEVQAEQLNILQLAILLGLPKLAKYILTEHKTLTSSRQAKVIDPRIILLNSF